MSDVIDEVKSQVAYLVRILPFRAQRRQTSATQPAADKGPIACELSDVSWNPVGTRSRFKIAAAHSSYTLDRTQEVRVREWPKESATITMSLFTARTANGQ